MAGYRDLVSEARACVDEVEHRGWRLAELAHEAVHTHGKLQREFAADIGVSRRMVGYYVQVWDRFGGTRGSLSFTEALANIKSPASEAVADEIGTTTSEAASLMQASQRAARDLPAEHVARSVRTALARPEVREQLATDSEAAAEVYDASAAIAEHEDHSAGHDRRRAVQPPPRPEHDRAMAEMEILVGLHKLFQLAQQNGLEEFLIAKLDETRDRLEMAIAAGSPERAVAELERWLAGQGEAA